MGKFKFIPTEIEDVIVVEPTVFGDERGFFMETYNNAEFAEAGINLSFVQDNHSRSKRGVLRGLHFQRQRPQGKMVRVVAGSILDVAVDMRPDSASYGKWVAVVLDENNKHQLYIPPYFAHGFLTLEDNTQVVYKCTELYDVNLDAGIRWDDPAIGIDWRLKEFKIDRRELTISDKDLIQPLLSEITRSIFDIQGTSPV